MTPKIRPESSAPWPDAMAELLLHSALDPSPNALDAFIGWKVARGLEQYSDVDFAAMCLLPSVFRNLTTQGLADPWLPQMGALCRYHWMRNSGRQRNVLEIVRSFVASGAPCIVLGGLALFASSYINNLGERPALVGEILIAPEDAPRLRTLLTSQRWFPAKNLPPVPGWRSETWRGPEHATLEVHYRWLPKPYPVVGVARLLEHARQVQLLGSSFHVPDAADQLLHACVCRRRITSDGSAPFIWVDDAMQIVARSGADVDWNRLSGEAQTLQTRAALCESLEYFRSEFGAAVPEEWLTRMLNADVTMAEKRLLLRASRKPTGLSWASFMDWVRRPWHDYVAADRAANRALSVKGFLQFWGWRAQCELARHKPKRVGQKVVPAAPDSPEAKAA